MVQIDDFVTVIVISSIDEMWCLYNVVWMIYIDLFVIVLMCLAMSYVVVLLIGLMTLMDCKQQ